MVCKPVAKYAAFAGPGRVPPMGATNMPPLRGWVGPPLNPFIIRKMLAYCHTDFV
ncbi:Uncharacterized protein dnm_007100 [Desulfonema magnum]|uniref:Uncharacterized protein n=1 Tax=Desulfonema magnum TaxID=45655 RepID=A0A975BG25_9BACT|nr:Uncharacterized protein dnm_007100 [Desulfonema magnum]